MIRYTSTKGGIAPVDFAEAVLSGFASDGGLFVPQMTPHFSLEELSAMKGKSYVELAYSILKSFIGDQTIPGEDLLQILQQSYSGFPPDNAIPVTRLGEDNIYIQELFHGPTLSFKDIAMGFLINCMDYLLKKRGERLSLILATTGDTGPAAAYAAAGKETLQCWPLFPAGMISEEQARQMTTLNADNIHPVAVENCRNGGDDLDVVVAKLFGDNDEKERLKLSSVNSINWCRVLMQTVHYFHGYFQVAENAGEEVVFSVPAGAFGNLCAGYLARKMGLPVKQFVCATNANGTLHRIFRDGVFLKKDLQQTVSSAIDIVVPYNFWRFLYLIGGEEVSIPELMDEFERKGSVTFSEEMREEFKKVFFSASISDELTLKTMANTYETFGYVLDPHGAVAVAAARKYWANSEETIKTICCATAHPAKFPEAVMRALGPESLGLAVHPSIEKAKDVFQRLKLCRYDQLETALKNDITTSLGSTGNGV